MTGVEHMHSLEVCDSPYSHFQNILNTLFSSENLSVCVAGVSTRFNTGNIIQTTELTPGLVIVPIHGISTPRRTHKGLCTFTGGVSHSDLICSLSNTEKTKVSSQPLNVH